MPANDLFEGLKNNGMSEFVSLFKAQGYDTFERLGSDENAAREAIKTVIGTKGGGWVTQVIELWKAAAPPCGLTTALTDAGRADLAKLFTSQGYLELTDLGGDESSALAAIKEILKNKPGAVRPILKLWKKA